MSGLLPVDVLLLVNLLLSYNNNTTRRLLAAAAATLKWGGAHRTWFLLLLLPALFELDCCGTPETDQLIFFTRGGSAPQPLPGITVKSASKESNVFFSGWRAFVLIQMQAHIQEERALLSNVRGWGWIVWYTFGAAAAFKNVLVDQVSCRCTLKANLFHYQLKRKPILPLSEQWTLVFSVVLQ